MDSQRQRKRPAWLVPALAVAGGYVAYKIATHRPRYSFTDKVVVITGGARGLGLVMARKLASEGAKLVICSRNSEQLRRAADELIGKFHARVVPVCCDVSAPNQAEQLVEQTIREFGNIDVLINDAGTIVVGPQETMDLVDYRVAMDVHFWAPLYLMRAAIPYMKDRGVGRIVNVSSIGGRISVPHLVPYSASKFALVGLSEGMRAELAKDGVLVTTVSPGLMRTGSPRNAIFKGQHKAEYAWFATSDSLPLVSMSAESAARQIIEACRRGDSEITLSLPARAAHLFHGIFPGLAADLMGLANRLLPGPGGIGHQRRRGVASQSKAAPSLLTALSDAAAKRNNEL
jgi:NAD(P)-dependent dehydrogenase (short-subunit alcohol dehydrogenase family)